MSVCTGSAGVMLRRGAAYLFLKQNDSGKWGPPKGHKEASDSKPADTAARELKEETGITILPQAFNKHAFVKVRNFDTKEMMKYYIYLIDVDVSKAFVKMPSTLKPNDKSEIGDYAWLTKEEALKKNLNVWGKFVATYKWF